MSDAIIGEFLKQFPAIIISLGTLIGVVLTFIVSFRTSKKATDIQTSTNGNLSAVTKELATATEKIHGLEAHSVALEKLVRSLAIPLQQSGAVRVPKVRSQKLKPHVK